MIENKNIVIFSTLKEVEWVAAGRFIGTLKNKISCKTGNCPNRQGH